MAQLTMQFFDVGQGDGIFIVFPNDSTMLVDLGSTKNKRVTGPDVMTYFRNHTKFGTPNQTLDYLVLTHGDRDHYNMVADFLDTLNVRVGNLMFGGYAADYGGLINTIKVANPHGNILTPTDNLPNYVDDPAAFGDVSVLVLAINTTPSSWDPAWRKNTGSVVLSITYSGITVLLAGDATTDTETFILQNMIRRRMPALIASNVLKIAHHGSHRTSNTASWMRLVMPEFAFISSDRSGSLDPEQKATGHRLPQYLTIDLLRRYSSRLYTGCQAHNYISSYDPGDYGTYNAHPDTPPGDALPLPFPLDFGKSWVETSTDAAVFTTIAKMDVFDPTDGDYDQGAQYALIIDDTGRIRVLSTYPTDDSIQADVTLGT